MLWKISNPMFMTHYILSTGQNDFWLNKNGREVATHITNIKGFALSLTVSTDTVFGVCWCPSQAVSKACEY